MEKLRENLGPGTLRMLGKAAASKYICGTCPDLTDSVIAVVKEAGSQYTKEHLARVCEFANHAVWDHVFAGKEKTAGFPLADVEKVTHAVYQSGDLPSPIRGKHSDYDKNPGDLFKSSSEKTAGVNHLHEHGIRPEYVRDRLFWELKAGMEHLTSSLQKTARAHLDSALELITVSANAMEGGATYPQIASALMQSGPAPWAKVAAADLVAPALQMYGYIKELPSEDIFEKIAHAYPVNPEHPVVQSFQHMQETAHRHLAYENAYRHIQPEWEKIKVAYAAEPAGTAIGALGDLLHHGVRGAGKGVELGGRGIAGAGKWLGKQNPLTVGGLALGGYVFGKPAVEKALHVLGQGIGRIRGGVSQPWSDYPLHDYDERALMG